MAFSLWERFAASFVLAAVFPMSMISGADRVGMVRCANLIYGNGMTSVFFSAEFPT